MSCSTKILWATQNHKRDIPLIASYDVSTLFTSVHIDPAITIIRRRLELDQELHLRTAMKVEQIISLLELCLKTTYF